MKTTLTIVASMLLAACSTAHQNRSINPQYPVDAYLYEVAVESAALRARYATMPPVRYTPRSSTAHASVGQPSYSAPPRQRRPAPPHPPRHMAVTTRTTYGHHAVVPRTYTYSQPQTTSMYSTSHSATHERVQPRAGTGLAARRTTYEASRASR